MQRNPFWNECEKITKNLTTNPSGNQIAGIGSTYAIVSAFVTGYTNPVLCYPYYIDAINDWGIRFIDVTNLNPLASTAITVEMYVVKRQ